MSIRFSRAGASNVANEDPEENSPCCKIFSFFSQSKHFTSTISKVFLFRPPQKKGYKFEKSIFVNGEMNYKFYLRSDRGGFIFPTIPENLEIFSYFLSLKKKSGDKNQVLDILPVIYLKNKETENNFLIIYSHGNASDLGDVFDFSKNVCFLYKVNVLAYDYRGYGISKYSKGSTNEQSTYEDLEYVLAFAQEKLHYQLSNIILWGFSLGTGPTIEIASRFQNIGGVILQSPLASLMIWLDKKAKWDYQYYHNDIFCSINKIQNIRAKIFIIHGTRDNTIDVRHSNLLYEKYTNFSKDNNQIWLVLVDGVGHNDIQYLIEEKEGIFFKKIQKFIDLVNYPLTLKHTAVFISHRRKNLKEQNRISFLEKEKKSLKISYDMLQINESCYKSASKAPLVSNSTNYLIDELKNKNDEHQYLCEDYETILLKLKTQSLSDQDINLTKNLHSTSLNFFFKKDEEKSRKNDWLILESVELEEVDICKKVEDFKNILSFNYFEKI